MLHMRGREIIRPVIAAAVLRQHGAKLHRLNKLRHVIRDAAEAVRLCQQAEHAQGESLRQFAVGSKTSQVALRILLFKHVLRGHVITHEQTDALAEAEHRAIRAHVIGRGQHAARHLCARLAVARRGDHAVLLARAGNLADIMQQRRKIEHLPLLQAERPEVIELKQALADELCVCKDVALAVPFRLLRNGGEPGQECASRLPRQRGVVCLRPARLHRQKRQQAGKRFIHGLTHPSSETGLPSSH